MEHQWDNYGIIYIVDSRPVRYEFANAEELIPKSNALGILSDWRPGVRFRRMHNRVFGTWRHIL